MIRQTVSSCEEAGHSQLAERTLILSSDADTLGADGQSDNI